MPAATVAALAVMFALQLALPRRIELPQPDAIVPLRLEKVELASVHGDVAITARALFASDRRGALAGSASGSETVSPLDGAAAVGVASRRGMATAFVQAPGGAVSSLRLGDIYHDWRLVRIATAGLTFRRGGETVTLALGAGPGTAGRQGIGQ